jgi:hypothetical protein
VFAPVGRSLVSTELALDKSGYLPLIFSDDDMETMLRVRGRVRSFRSLQSGQDYSDAAGCGEGRAVATQQVSEAGAVATASPQE